MGEKTRADLAECVDQAASLIAAAKIVHIGTAQRKIEAALNPDRWEKLVRGLREAARALRSTPEADPRFAVERGFDGPASLAAPTTAASRRDPANGGDMPQRLDDLPEWFAPVNDLYEAEDGRLTAAEFYALAEMLNWVEVNYRSSPLPRTEELEAWADQHQEAEVWATGMRLCRAAGPRLRHPRGEQR